jgi:Acetylglutamate semialdehyde dehydrogenase
MGLELYRIHKDLYGETDLKFSNKIGSPDIIFLCLGHGLSRYFLDKNPISDNCKVIDLGNDFRIESTYKQREFIYGLTDVFINDIISANNIANPGCFATAIQYALAPLADKNKISEEIHIHAITGSTGAGKKLSDLNHYSYRDNNLSIYKPFTHQHLGEINRTLSHILGTPAPKINFIPIRGNFTRGIFASIYTKWDGDEEMAISMFEEYYKKSPFVFVSRELISLKEVINTNKCLLHIELHNGYIHITSIIDNLIKGAAGQAIENMNIMFGLDRRTGLKLKPSAF